MATYRFPCPACGKTLKVDDAMLADIRRRGKGGHCPRCKTPVPVEGVGQPVANDAQAGKPSPRRRRRDGGTSR